MSRDKKNGRAGQEQNGVDVYGIPVKENEYYGIQCKGKDEYTNKKLSKSEINKEIKKAKGFKPKLKKFYFATTAVKDSKIETYIREKNIEHRKLGLFEIHLFSWEDIVDLIYENKETFDYYVRSINFKTNFSVSVTFQNNEKEITISPKFLKEVIHYKQKIIPQNEFLRDPFLNFISKQQQSYAVPRIIGNDRAEKNLSYSSLSFKIHNTGISPLEKYKLIIEIIGNISEIADTNINTSGYGLLIRGNLINRDTFVDSESNSIKVTPIDSVLVGDDTFLSDEIFLKPLPISSTIRARWKLISKAFKDQGELLIHIDPKIENKSTEILVEDPLKVRIKEKEIEDYIVEEE